MATSFPLVLALGDSLVAGYGLPTVAGFPAQLEPRLQPRYPLARVINAGVSGDTTGGVLRRLPRLLSGLSGRPDLAVVQVGPNDVLQQVPPSRTRANLDAILTELGRCGVPVLLTTIAPPAFLQYRAASYLGIQEEVAVRHGAFVVPFFPAGVLGRSDMVLADGLHPNAKAITAVVDAMLPVVQRGLTTAARGWTQQPLAS